MGKLPLAVVVSALVTACALREPILKQDLDAWAGVPLIELETHPGFSVLPRDIRKLSDGTELWVVTNCAAYQNRARQVVSEACCYSSFRVAESKVASMSMRGSCRSECSDRPTSKPCTRSDEVDHVGHY